MTTTTRPLTHLRPGTVIAVSGISFHQDVAATVRPGDEVRLTHEVSNPFDSDAVLITTLDGREIGHVPKSGRQNSRLVLGHRGGVWGGVVTERYDHDTIGLRVRIDTLLGHRDAAFGSDQPGIRDLDRDTPVPAPGPEPVEKVVTSPSGRILGVLVGADSQKVRVLTPQGRTVAYPASVVVVNEPVTA